MTIEKIVRPYRLPDFAPPRVVVTASDPQSADPVVLTYGKSWSVKTMNGSETLDVTFYAVKHMHETSATGGQSGTHD